MNTKYFLTLVAVAALGLSACGGSTANNELAGVEDAVSQEASLDEAVSDEAQADAGDVFENEQSAADELNDADDLVETDEESVDGVEPSDGPIVERVTSFDSDEFQALSSEDERLEYLLEVLEAKLEMDSEFSNESVNQYRNIINDPATEDLLPDVAAEILGFIAIEKNQPFYGVASDGGFEHPSDLEYAMIHGLLDRLRMRASQIFNAKMLNGSLSVEERSEAEYLHGLLKELSVMFAPYAITEFVVELMKAIEHMILSDGGSAKVRATKNIHIYKMIVVEKNQDMNEAFKAARSESMNEGFSGVNQEIRFAGAMKLSPKQCSGLGSLGGSSSGEYTDFNIKIIVTVKLSGLAFEVVNTSGSVSSTVSNLREVDTLAHLNGEIFESAKGKLGDSITSPIYSVEFKLSDEGITELRIPLKSGIGSLSCTSKVTQDSSDRLLEANY